MTILASDYTESCRLLEQTKHQLQMQQAELLRREGHADNYRKLLDDAMRSVSRKHEQVNALQRSVEQLTEENRELLAKMEAVAI